MSERTDTPWPSHPLRMRATPQGRQVWDVVRRKWVHLTPEEWVRQQLVHYLIVDKKFPTQLIAVERGLSYNGLNKRFDVLAYDRAGQPLLLAECKAPEVALDEYTLQQIAVYNSRFGARHLLVTNGHTLALFTYDTQHGYQAQALLPEFDALQ